MALSTAGKVAYSATFLVLVPAALVLWARGCADLVMMPVWRSAVGGGLLAGAGVLVMLAGMRGLWRHGGGLPMNAAPPPRFVDRGAYRILPHPIYLGFCVVCAGVSIAVGSASGLWLVTPVAALGCAALVIGYEHQDLRRRFGEMRGVVVLPVAEGARPAGVERVRCLLIAVLPWMLAAAAEVRWGGQGAVGRWLMGACVVVLGSWFLLCGTRRALRWMAVRSMAAMLIAGAVFLALPAEVPAWVTAVAGALVLLAAANVTRCWEWLRAGAEGVANSWRAWAVGRQARFVDHGLYAGAGGLLMVWLGASMAGRGHVTAIVLASCCAVVGAALWAQWVEGSAELLRPYGFYGGLLGGTVGSVAGLWFQTSPWLLLAVFAAVGSWAQGVGRLRCLVQGCCHGGPAPAWLGIRYVHPRSRVCRFTAWAGVPLHPTPVYSMLWNLLVGELLVRLWVGHAALALIIGLYFILSGAGRFAEEGWRGEPQTKTVRGLRVYQWAALGSVVAGMVFAVTGSRAPAPTPQLSWAALAPAVVFGAVVACAMGLDFPESNRRFSRLA